MVLNLITLGWTHPLWLTITPHRSVIKPEHVLHINLHTHAHTHVYCNETDDFHRVRGGRGGVCIFWHHQWLLSGAIALYNHHKDVSGAPFPTIAPWLIGNAVCAQFHWSIGISVLALGYRSGNLRKCVWLNLRQYIDRFWDKHRLNLQ